MGRQCSRRGILIDQCTLAIATFLCALATTVSVLFGLSGRPGYAIGFMFLAQANAVLIGRSGLRIARARDSRPPVTPAP